MDNTITLNPRRWAIQLALITGLTLLCVTALLWGLQDVTPARADPGTLFVDGATGGDDSDCSNPADPCATIGYALTQAGSDDEIRVAHGTYTENLTIDGTTLTLRGGYTISGTDWLPGTGETIVDGNGIDRTFLIRGNNSVLEDLTITGGDTPDGQCWGGGLWITNGDVTIRDSLVTGNWADCSGAGMEVNNDFGPAHLTLVDSIVFDNQSGGECGGVSVWRTGAHLTNTLIISNTGGTASALRIEDSDVTVQNSTIADNQGSVAVNAYDTDALSDVLTLRNSIVWGNTDGDLACSVVTCSVTYSAIGDGWAGTGNTDADPQFVDASGGDYHLEAWSPCIDAGTAEGAPDRDFEGDARPQNAGFDMGVDEFVGTPIPPGLLFVDGATGSDSTACRNPAAPCETIGYALTGAGNGDEIRVAQGTYTENLTININIALEGGYESAGWTRSITQHETIIDGGGSVISQPVITIRDGGDGTVLDGLTITGGDGELAGGVHAESMYLTIRNCLIRHNYADGGPDSMGAGGVLRGPGGGQLSIVDSRIVNNEASQGASGVRVHQALLVMTNVLVAGNRGEMGVNLNGAATLMNATVADNDGGIQLNTEAGGTLVITNSIVYGNGWSVAVEGNAVAQIAYSDIEGGWAGAGNINTDPLSVGGGDYHLGVGSPCIDKGTLAGAPAYDIEGTPRGAAPDMGAYEWTGFHIYLPFMTRNIGP